MTRFEYRDLGCERFEPAEIRELRNAATFYRRLCWLLAGTTAAAVLMWVM